MSEHKHDVRVAGCYRCELGADEAIAALTAERDHYVKSWKNRLEALAAAEAQVERLTAELSRAHAMLDSDMPRWDADRLVIEQGWNTPDRCGRCGEVNPQVERYREALERIARLQDHTIGMLPSTPIALAALVGLDADPPRDRQECAFCKGAGNLAVARVVGRKVFHDERPCPKCGGSGLAPADPPREPRECCCGHDEVTHPGGGWCGEDCYCSSFRPTTPREPEA